MYREMLVHLDASPESAARLDLAVRLAGSFDAHLTGLYVVPPDPVPVAAVSPGMAGAVVPVKTSDPLSGHADEVEDRFGRCTRAEDVAARWCREDGLVTDVVSGHARFADLLIVGQDPPRVSDLHAAKGLAEDISVRTGCPLLVTPAAGPLPSLPGTRVLVAWNGSREAARALHDSIAFLRRARKVRVITVEGGSRHAPDGLDDDRDPSSYLRRHGVDVEYLKVSKSASVCDALIACAEEGGCDLLVMGCHGHSRLRELVFGAATRDILSGMTLPVLISH